MTRDVWVSWEEPYRDDEIVHQLERGQKRPTHARCGLVLQFFPHVEQLRVGGIIDSKTMLAILDEDRKQIIVTPLTAVKFHEASVPPAGRG